MSSSMIFGALLVSLAVALAAPAAGDEKKVPTLDGPCPEFKPIASMDGVKLDGEWHLISTVKKGIEKKGTIKCVKKTVTSKPDGGFDSVLSANKDGQQKTKTVHATPIAGQIGKFTIAKDSNDPEEGHLTKTGTLLATDGKFLLESVCVTDNSKHAYMISVFGRESTLDAATEGKARAAANAANVKDELHLVEGC